MHALRWLSAAGLVCLLASGLGCSGQGGSSDTHASAETPSQAAGDQAASGKSPPADAPPSDPIVVLHTTAGDIKIQLFAQQAPQTVENFVSQYVARGFYEQTIFHHVEPGQMVIGGGYDRAMAPKAPRTPIFNESRNGLSNRRGTIAMIRDPESPHSATSQFFINLKDNPELDFKAGDEEDALGYCVFGEVIEGLQVVEKIGKLPTESIGEFASVPSPVVSIDTVQRLR